MNTSDARCYEVVTGIIETQTNLQEGANNLRSGLRKVAYVYAKEHDHVTE